MPDYNIQMKQRNTDNTGWDNLHPKTKAANVVATDGKTLEVFKGETEQGLDNRPTHSLAQAINDFLVASQAGQWVRKSLEEVKVILSLGSAAFQNIGYFATAAQGTKADNALPKAGGTLTGNVIANAGADHTTKRVRNTVYKEVPQGTPISDVNFTVAELGLGDIGLIYDPYDE